MERLECAGYPVDALGTLWRGWGVLDTLLRCWGCVGDTEEELVSVVFFCGGSLVCSIPYRGAGVCSVDCVVTWVCWVPMEG